jgi:ketosteroid isomerase-like protein
MTSGAAITDADFRRYIAAFNRSDFAAFSQYYSPQIHFQGQAGEFHSRAEVVSFYRQVKARLRETIKTLTLVIGKHDIVAELETELHALVDWPDFPTGPIYRGETRRSHNFVWYEVADGMIESIRSARYRSIPDASANNDTPPWVEREDSSLHSAEPEDPSPQSAMSAEQFSAYIDAFNRDDIATYGDYYADNVVLVLAGKTELHGRKAIFDFYEVVKSQTRRTLQINKFVATPNHLAVELESEFLALQDLPEFTAGPMRKGGRIFINTFVLYDLRDGKFARIRSAQFRKIARP